MSKFTQWFQPSMQPARAGVYEAEWDSEHPEVDSGEWYNKWDGARWYLGGISIRDAEKQKKIMPPNVKLIRWRGLTHNDQGKPMPELEANYRATGDADAANAIRAGMTAQRCKKLAPEEREHFGSLCPKPPASEQPSVAFSSAG